VAEELGEDTGHPQRSNAPALAMVSELKLRMLHRFSAVSLPENNFIVGVSATGGGSPLTPESGAGGTALPRRVPPSAPKLSIKPKYILAKESSLPVPPMPTAWKTSPQACAMPPLAVIFETLADLWAEFVACGYSVLK